MHPPIFTKLICLRIWNGLDNREGMETYMKITFDSNIQQTPGYRETDAPKASRRAQEGCSAYRTELYGGVEREWEQTAAKKNKAKNTQDIQAAAEGANITQYQNLMTVMSHTLSQEDYAQLEKDGFRLEDMDPQTAVTILDKIKAELARSGQHIVGYTDDLDPEVLAEALGSSGLARAITESFREADIPATEENIHGAAQAVEMASGLDAPENGETRYMIDNGLEPEIQDLYLAENSGADQGSGRGPRYYADDIGGYFSEAAGVENPEALTGQVERALSRMELEDTEQNRAAAMWLVENGLPLNEENMAAYQKLASVEFPVSRERAARAAAQAIAEGKEPARGNLAQEQSIYEKAAAALEHYTSGQAEEGLDVTARRRLEEIRLRMTAEVNVRLLRSGFSIDTAPMEELIGALKKAEQEIARQYFPEEENALAKYEQYRDARRVVEDIPTLPAQILGTWAAETAGGPAVQHSETSGGASDAAEDTLGRFYEEGAALRETYQKAGETYEALMTAPRSDMGDSIRKAFANVDDILKDLGLDCTEENRKAVRILGYNRMEITADNLSMVRNADARVREIVEKMTPAATLRMIRDGVNPLEKSFEELQEYFDALPEEFEKQADSYSRFLYGLERGKEITQEERDAYVGVYRLLHQVEKSDGAAVGTLVNTGAELNFSNLLSAVRTSKAKRVDVKINEEYGAVSELVEKGVSISEQIASGYGGTWNNILTEVSQSEEAQQEYRRQNLESFRQAARADSGAAALLERGEIPVTAGNLVAAQALQTDSSVLFSRWDRRSAARTASGKENASKAAPEANRRADGFDPAEGQPGAETVTNIEQVWETLADKDSFREGYGALMENLTRELEGSTLEAASYVDVKSLRLLHRQLNIAGQLAQQEEYHVPVEIAGELTTVHLTIRQQESGRGRVSVSMDVEDAGPVEGHFQVRDGKLSGYFTGNGEETVTKLKSAADIFSDHISENLEVEEIRTVDGLTGKAAFPDEQPEYGRAVGSNELYQAAKEFLTAVKTVFSRTE